MDDTKPDWAGKAPDNTFELQRLPGCEVRANFHSFHIMRKVAQRTDHVRLLGTYVGRMFAMRPEIG